MSLRELMGKNGVSIVLGTYNRKRLLKCTIVSLRSEIAKCNFPLEIIVIDGGSTDGTLNWLIKQKDIITIIQHNRGEFRGKPIPRRSWGYFMNLGFKIAQGKYVCMVSDDCLVIPGAIKNGYDLFERELNAGKKIGAVAFYWRSWPHMKNYLVGLTLGKKLFVNHGMYLKHALEDVNYIDEDSFTFYHADGDLCLKMWQKGYSCIDSPMSFVEHHFHNYQKVIKATNQAKDWQTYLNKWKGIFYDGQPANLAGSITKQYIDPTATWMTFLNFSITLKLYYPIFSNKLKRNIGFRILKIIIHFFLQKNPFFPHRFKSFISRSWREFVTSIDLTKS